MLVVDRDGEAFDLGLTRGEVLDGRIGNRVGPGQLTAAAGARGVMVHDRGERAQRGSDRRPGRRHHVHIRQVDIRERDDAAIGQIAGRRHLFRHRAADILGRNDRLVIGAGDGDIDLLGDQAAVLVVDRDGEAFDLGLTRGQVFDGRVGNRVGPGQLPAGASARGVMVHDRAERAKRGADRRPGRRHQMYVRQVDIPERDDAAVRQIAGRRHLFRHRTADIRRRNNRCVVGAGDCDRDVLRYVCAVVVGDRNGIDLSNGLPNGQRL